jgi:hypothetical protein
MEHEGAHLLLRLGHGEENTSRCSNLDCDDRVRSQIVEQPELDRLCSPRHFLYAIGIGIFNTMLGIGSTIE